MVEKVQVGGAPAKHAEHWKAWNRTVFLKVHDSHLQEDIPQQQQKIRPATIERGYS